MATSERAQRAAELGEHLKNTDPISRSGGPVDDLPVLEEITLLASQWAWGEVWSRPGLDLRTRSAVTIALLASQGRADQLRTHINGGLNNGLEPEEIVEILFHMGAYAGLGAVSASRNIAREVFRERGILRA
jgi:alkylhydroperoxidase/carboxymuconolactone decarboxylase family protein YurZ